MAIARYGLRVAGLRGEHLKNSILKLPLKLFYLATRNAQHAASHTTRSKNQVVDFGTGPTPGQTTNFSFIHLAEKSSPIAVPVFILFGSLHNCRSGDKERLTPQ